MQTCASAENGQKMFRRSNSSGSGTTHKVFLSSAVVGLIAPPPSAGKGSAAGASGASVALTEALRSDPLRAQMLRDSIGRVCDSVYESCLDACSQLLNSAGDATLVRSSLGIIAEVRFRAMFL